MKKTFLFLMLVVAINSYSQVGIGTNSPNATLDVSSSNTSDNSITINSTNDPNNSLNKNYLTLDNNGNLNIGGAFKPNNNSGQPESYLISNGPNNPPTWQTLQKKIIYNAFQIIFLSYQNVTLQSGVLEDVKFVGATISEFDQSVGVWENDNSRFKINQSGTYLITWDTKVELGNVSTTTSVGPGYSLLYYGIDKSNYYKSNGAAFTCNSIVCDSFYEDTATRLVLTNSYVYLKLNAGDYVSVAVFGTAYNSQEMKLVSGSLKIKKVEVEA